MKSNYKRLGDLISPVSVKNTDMVTDDLRGVNYQKYFMPSVANTIGVDLSGYKMISKGQFACNLMHVGRDECLPIALHREDKPIIVSPAYFSFEVKNEKEILPEFLFLWFKRSEFDREACFYTDADVRQGLIKSSFMDIQVPVPPIEAQRRIVTEYQANERRIENNRRLIATLEATAQTIYRKMFVDNIDPNNLPQDWRMGTIGEFCKETKSGGTPSRTKNEYWDNKDYRWLKSGEVANNVIFDTEEYISEKGLNGSSAKIIPSGAVVMAMYGATASQVTYLDCDTTTNQACCNMLTNSFEEAAYLYFHCLFQQENIKRLANGGAQENLSQEVICNQPMIIPVIDVLQPFSKLLMAKIAFSKENYYLSLILSLLLSKLSNI
ncbi:MAG: restriction endonuclease subunit S [Muribaculaceae bacterium]|nr:restriction endonuclease subunit S [Muribaculaceae bacterium]